MINANNIFYIRSWHLYDGNSEHVAHTYGGKYVFHEEKNVLEYDSSRSKQMPRIDQITDITPTMRTNI